MRELQIGFIGGGNMAQAMLAGLVRAGHAVGRLVVAEPAAAQRERLAALGRGIRGGLRAKRQSTNQRGQRLA